MVFRVKPRPLRISEKKEFATFYLKFMPGRTGNENGCLGTGSPTRHRVPTHLSFVRINKMHMTTISNDPEWYEAWPDVALTPGGKLIAVFAECVTHLDRSRTRIALSESTDRGATWSAKRAVTPVTGPNEMFYNCPRIVPLRDGRLCVIVDRNLHGGKAETTPQSEVVLLFSDDEGQNWSRELPTPIRGIVPDRLLETEDGRWMIATHYLVPESGRLEAFLWHSGDQGKNWRRVKLAADPRYHLCESSLISLGNGVLAAFMRENSGLGYDCMKCLSTDNGETWSKVIPFPLPGCHRPVIGLLQEGKFLITYRFMQGGRGWLGSWCQNLFGAITDRESILTTAREGAAARIFPIDYDRSGRSDLGYSGHVQFPDGMIYVVNYIMDDAAKAQIRGYSFYLSDLVLP